MQQTLPCAHQRPGIGQMPTSLPDGPLPAEWRRLRQDLRQAVREGSFSLAFQARRRLRDNAHLGEDTQLRWSARGRGVVQSSTFMPLVEECGLTTQVAEWTLGAVCRAGAAWREGMIAATVPASVARDGRLLTMVGDALMESGLEPERLEIALADSAVCSDCTDTLLSLSALRDLGVGVALDDYGRAGACLIKLKRLPLTAIKLDRSLVRDMLCDRAAASMVRAAIDFAHTLDIDVIASGVETDAQRGFLRHIGCDAALERHVHGAPAFHEHADHFSSGHQAPVRDRLGPGGGALSLVVGVGARRPNMPAMAKPDPETLQNEILRLARAVGSAKSICPSEVARALAEDWRPLMKPVREAAVRLARSGQLHILRHGKPVADLDIIRGVIRLRIAGD